MPTPSPFPQPVTAYLPLPPLTSNNRTILHGSISTQSCYLEDSLYVTFSSASWQASPFLSSHDYMIRFVVLIRTSSPLSLVCRPGMAPHIVNLLILSCPLSHCCRSICINHEPFILSPDLSALSSSAASFSTSLIHSLLLITLILFLHFDL